MAGEWGEVRIEEIAERVAMGPFGSSIKVETFVPEGVPVISGQHLHGFKVDDTVGFNFITPEHAERLKNANVQRGDIIFTHAGNIGQVAYIPDDSKYERYVISQRQFYVRCDRSKVIPEFVVAFFKTPEGQHRLLANTSQVGVPSIAQPVTYLRTIEIPLPPLSEQRAIAHILGTLDDKIELNRRMSQTLEAMARALFRSWFINATRDGLPEGWCEVSILDFADLLSGGTPRTEVPEYWDGDIPWVSAKDVTKARNLFILSTERKITKAGVENSASKVLPALTTIVSARGTVGNHCLLGREMAMNQTNYGLRAKDNRSHYFVFFNVAHLVEELRQQAYGTIFDTITTRTFQHTKIVRPPDVIIQRFESVVGSLMRKVLVNLLESETLAALRDALLPKLISGELRVMDAERFLKERGI